MSENITDNQFLFNLSSSQDNDIEFIGEDDGTPFTTEPPIIRVCFTCKEEGVENVRKFKKDRSWLDR